MENENKGSQSNGMELLENVIKSNMENIEQNIKVRFGIEDLRGLLNEIQSGFKEKNLMYDEVLTSFKLEQDKRTEFLKSIPLKIETVLSQETIEYYERFHEKIKRMERFIWTGIGVVIFAILLLVISVNFATNWYKESVKAKSELRQDILDEIAGEGKKIYNENEIKVLRENTQVMQFWIKNNPKNAEGFLRFKDGFDARKSE